LQGAKWLISCLQQVLKRASDVECYSTYFYGFSTENWKHSHKEINDILFVMEQKAQKFYDMAPI
jgi:undecaprenyl pyrophosphate synthase